MDFDSLNHRPNAEILRKRTFLCHENLINNVKNLFNTNERTPPYGST